MAERATSTLRAGTTVRLEDRDVAVWGVVALVRNHPGHAREMGGSAPEDPIGFVKPPSALFRGTRLKLPRGRGRVEFEAELAVLLDRDLRRATQKEARHAVAGVGVLLDLTLRDEQAELKERGRPWLMAKGFDRSAPTSRFVPPPPGSLGRLRVVLEVDGQLRQDFRANEYLHPPERALALLSKRMTLTEGTVVALGSGPGVGALDRGQSVRARLSASDDVLASVGFRAE